ncbi:MAG: pyruvate kinase [Microgenomates group bacterium]
MKKFTKIVATIGPTSDTRSGIISLIKAGVNVFRFNMKHNTIAWHEERIGLVEQIAEELHTNVGILIDLQGPEIRLETPDKQSITLKKGDRYPVTSAFIPGVQSICVPLAAVFSVLKVGDAFLIDDGFIEATIVEVSKDGFIIEMKEDAVIKHRKGVNFPGIHIDLPSLISDDLLKLDMASKNKVDFVALSFTRTKTDIEILREEMKKRHVEAMIIAKIESQPALDHLKEIITAADGIMVARGDLGIETPIERLAYEQKQMIIECRKQRKPVIVATQMLQSMCDNPRPTRAEATDVANAVYDLTDATMLSQESASGLFPEKSVSTMTRILAWNEKHTIPSWVEPVEEKATDTIVHAMLPIVMDTKKHTVDAIVVLTETGYTARCVSSTRPGVPIIAVSDNKKTIETLTLSYGVIPVQMQFPASGLITTTDDVISELKKMELVNVGHKVILIHGSTWKKPGLTNTVSLVTVE